MMNKWSQMGIIFGVTAISSYGYVALTLKHVHLIDWLNTIFIIALIYMVCSAGVVFIYSPPFRRLSYNFTYFFSKLKRENEMADDLERKQRSYKGDELEEKKHPSWTTSLFMSGIFIAAFSMILSLIESS